MRDYGITNAAPYASAPAVGTEGEIYWNTAEKALYGSDGIVWNKIGPLPGGNPTLGGDLSGTASDATVLKSRGDFTVGGQGIVPGDATLAQLLFGSQTVKTRMQVSNALAASWWALAVNRNPNSGAVDDTAKTAWQLTVNNNSDLFEIGRVPASGAYARLLGLGGNGALTLGNPISGAAGYAVLYPGGDPQPGYLAFFTKEGTRRGYIGFRSGTGTHLLLQGENTYGWNMVVPDGDDGFRITATTPSIFIDTPARAGMWFGSTANTGRWYYGHEASGGAGAGLRMYNSGAGGDIFTFFYNGTFRSKGYVSAAMQYIWMGLTSAPTIATGAEAALPFGSVIANNGCGTQGGNTISLPANSVCLIGATMLVPASNWTVWLQQHDGSVWRKRIGMSCAPGAIAAQLNTFGLIDTRWGTLVHCSLSNASGTNYAPVMNDQGPWLWAVVLGRYA